MAIVSKKDTSIETLRGLAIILVVMGHVIGSAADGGMKVADDSFLRHLYYTFQYLRMPLFTVISGWVYALWPAQNGQIIDFNIKKIRRLLFPLFLVGGIYYTMQSVIPGTNFSYELKDIWRILVFPYTFYWYLQSLFIVFVLISFVDAYGLINKFSRFLVFFIVTLFFLLIRDMVIPQEFPNYFGFKGAIYLFPFFVIGIGIKRFKQQLSNRVFVWLCAAILIVGLVIQQLIWYQVINYNLSSSGGLGLIIGVTGVVVCLRINFSVKWLVWMGSYAYTIYLFHSFGTSGGRIILHKLGLTFTPIVFFISLALGLFLPILLEEIFKRFGITRLLFLGRSFKKKK